MQSSRKGCTPAHIISLMICWQRTDKVSVFRTATCGKAPQVPPETKSAIQIFQAEV